VTSITEIDSLITKQKNIEVKYLNMTMEEPKFDAVSEKIVDIMKIVDS